MAPEVPRLFPRANGMSRGAKVAMLSAVSHYIAPSVLLTVAFAKGSSSFLHKHVVSVPTRLAKGEFRSELQHPFRKAPSERSVVCAEANSGCSVIKAQYRSPGGGSVPAERESVSVLVVW